MKCCSRCFNPKRTSFLKFIEDNGIADNDRCPFCGRPDGIKIDVSVLGEFILRGVARAYDSFTGREQAVDDGIRTYSLYEILMRRVFLFDRDNNAAEELTMKLLKGQDIYEPLWSLKMDYGEEDAKQYRIWKNFEHDCKYYNRFFDLTSGKQGGSEDNILHGATGRTGMLTSLYDTCFRDLQIIIPAGFECYRARVIDASLKRGVDYDLEEASIGPATIHNSESGRMNPEGITYFYVAQDRDTALKESRLRGNDRVLIGRFAISRPLKVIDWTKANIYEKAVDIFSQKYSPSMAVYQDFLRQFAIEVGKPNELGRNIEYVATQLVAEFVRGKGYDGIKYDSSVGNGYDVVFFYGPRTDSSAHHEFNTLPDYTDIAQLMEVSEFKIKIEYLIETEGINS